MLILAGPGAGDRNLWSALDDSPDIELVGPERVERAVRAGRTHELLRVPRRSPDAVRALGVRDGRLAGIDTRRAWPGLLSARAVVLQVVCEPTRALDHEIRRLVARTNVLHERPDSAAKRHDAGSSPPRMLAQIRPYLAYERRGAAHTPPEGRRLILAREELATPSTALLETLAAALGPSSIPTAPLVAPDDATALLCEISRELWTHAGVRFEAGLQPTSTAFGPEAGLWIELARVPSIAHRAGLEVCDGPLSLVVEHAAWKRIPENLRGVLTTTGGFQHRLEEEFLPRWIERTAAAVARVEQQARAIGAEARGRVLEDLASDRQRLLAHRPDLARRWTDFSAVAGRAMAR